jgi:hypothetical protein
MKQRILMIGSLVVVLLLARSGPSRGSGAVAPAIPDGGAVPGRHLGVTDLAYLSHAVDDDGDGDSIGNGDGALDCGETIELYVGLENQGTETVLFVDATISTADPYVTWTGTTSAYYGDIIGGATVTNTVPFDLSVACAAPDGHQIDFDLDIVDVESEHTYDSFTVTVSRFDADVDGSGCVNVTDVGDVAADWRCADPDPCYESAHDLDGNGIITVVDIMKVAAYWGWCCS